MNPKATATSSGRPTGLWKFAIMVVAVVAALGFLVYRFNPVSAVIKQADTGFKKATNTIDPEVLRAWALDNIRKQSSKREISASMPKELRELYKHQPSVSVNGSNLWLNWGGGFFGWFIRIGDTNDIMPFNSNNPEFPYNFEWRPGIYYSRETAWKLQ